MAPTHESPAPSAVAMDRFLENAPGLREPRLAASIPGLPTLPDLKKLARDQQEAGREVIDQSAGDIADVNQPMSQEFVRWVEEVRGQVASRPGMSLDPGSPYNYPGNYIQQFPFVCDKLWESWGARKTPFAGVQTISGRTILDFTFRGLVARAKQAGKSGRMALIIDPIAWSGYKPLARDLDLALVHAPVVDGHGLTNSAEGLRAAAEFARSKELEPIGVVPIVPSNPTGVGIEGKDLKALVEAAAGEDLPVVIDAFYSPLAPEGHAQCVPLGYLEDELAPEALAYLGVIVGETKVVSSQNKTGSLLWMAPEGHRQVADPVVSTAATRMRSTNAYPRPQEALVAYALHTFPDGIHAAMGPRYKALDETRDAMRQACDDIGVPLSIGGSFYGTAALVDGDGQPLVRDAEGRPVTDPREVCETLIERFGLVGAPGGMFSAAPEANKMVRLTAAVTLDDVAKVRAIMARMVEEAAAHG